MSATAMFGPLAAALVCAVGIATAHRRLPPHIAARVVTVVLGVVVASALPTLWIVTFGYVAHTTLFHGVLLWCAEALGIHHPIPDWAGLTALVVTAAGMLRAQRAMATYRALQVDERGPVEVTEDGRPYAYTLPGRGGRVVMSAAMVEMLDDDERAVVLAHERAHARFRHDRYLLVAQVAAAVVPVVRPLTRRLQFTLERWADEAAVRSCGDRGLVARTLAKVALSQPSASPALGFTGLGVSGRVSALLGPAPTRPHSWVVAGIWSAVALTAALSLYQLHHLAMLVVSLCTR